VICLDTNYLIRALVPGTPQAEQVKKWLRAGQPLAASSIAWYEFCCGPVSPVDQHMAQIILTGGILPFQQMEAEEAGRLFNAVGRQRRLRVDSMIAATALAAKAPLATANLDDFRFFVPFGLRLLEE
jgi:predicted nucleic acid-binding protein